MYAVYKVVKHFRRNLLINHCIIFVPHPAVRLLFVQQELGERRVSWTTSLQEYDLEFKPFHTINGHGLCWLSVEVVKAAEDDPSRWEQEIDIYNVNRATPTTISDTWYANMCQYLEHGTFTSHISTQ